jgi:DUF438 domain-containing protein
MAEITGVNPEIKYKYNLNLTLSKTEFEQITALEKKFTPKGIKVWAVKELVERHAKAFPSPTLE